MCFSAKNTNSIFQTSINAKSKFSDCFASRRETYSPYRTSPQIGPAFSFLSVSSDSVAKGRYLWSTFVVENNTLTSSKTKESSYDEKLTLDKIQIWGVTSKVTQVFLNDREMKFEYSDKQQVSFVLSLSFRKCEPLYFPVFERGRFANGSEKPIETVLERRRSELNDRQRTLSLLSLLQ